MPSNTTYRIATTHSIVSQHEVEQARQRGGGGC